MPLTPKLNKYITASPTVITADFKDLASGVGIKVLDAGDVKDGSLLTDFSFWGFDGQTEAADTTPIDIDFDTSVFTNSLFIGGKAVVDFTATGWRYANGEASSTWTISATVRIWDGTTETDLASDSHDLTSSATVANQGTNKLISFQLDIPKTNIKKGSLIRLTIQASAAGTNRKVRVFHDPKDRTKVMYNASGTLDTVTTKCRLFLPIIVN